MGKPTNVAYVIFSMLSAKKIRPHISPRQKSVDEAAEFLVNQTEKEHSKK
jgi:hypothetical protein